jgi:SAM-dependent methyltransferase
MSHTWNNDSVRVLERESIEAFVKSVAFSGRVLDFGCGHRPYESIVAGQGATYEPYDRAFYRGSVGENIGADYPLKLNPGGFDVILCTQVIQYVQDPAWLFDQFYNALKLGGRLVMTYPTCWDEVEPDDLWRFTKAGMEFHLREAMFEIERHDRRAVIDLGGFKFPLGYGVVAHT